MKTLIASIFYLLIPALSLASEMRPANGQPCHPTEKTYFDKDGTTPYGCKLDGGQEYSFTVYSGDKLVWKGTLPKDKPEVYLQLQENELHGSLVLKRTSRGTSSHSGIYFGESSMVGVKTFEGGGNRMQVPQVREVGNFLMVPTNGSPREVHIGKLPGAVFDQNDYRIVIQQVQ